MDGTESRPSKRTKLLSDDDSSGSDGETTGGVPLPDHGEGRGSKTAGTLSINQDYAKRYEHNMRRKEIERLEENDDESSSDESEDDDAEFATTELDSEITATLNALRSKDPRIYDHQSTFYRPFDSDAPPAESGPKKEKPMSLQDYQRRNLLADGADAVQDDGIVVPQTYDQEQEALRKKMVGQMHAAAADDDDDLLVQKSKHVPDTATRRKTQPALDVETADKDPETFLSNFMAARAWVPDENSRFAHLDSDDSEDERKADTFEQAYNMRFEDPKGANEKLVSYGRDVAKHSVRREEANPRQRQRDREREAKEQAKQQRHEEKARLRKLKINMVDEKVRQIKEAAGLKADDVVNLDEWRDMLDGDFDDDKWEQAMEKRFGTDYYAEQDQDFDLADSEDDGAKQKKKLKKPKWQDDINIKDIVSDSDDDDQDRPQFTLTDDEAEDEINEVSTTDIKGDQAEKADKREKPKSRKEQAADRKRAARQQRLRIEEHVDEQMDLDLPDAIKVKGGNSMFRYRDTEPISFGLSSRDILFADDNQLNQFAGMKKHHAFRDEERMKKDKKKLGKKARLRQWRKDTFGNEEGYAGDFASYVKSKAGVNGVDDMDPPAAVQSESKSGEGKKKKKRKRKSEAVA